MNVRRIALGVSGGIAAYKAAALARLLRKNGVVARVVMTENARKFVSETTFETLTGQRCYLDTFEHPDEIEHISLAEEAELFVVAPATANILGKLACGIADDILSTCLMATRAKILVAPAMNAQMWLSPATQHNVRVLRERGVLFVGPDEGALACGDTNVGRMAEPEAILQAVWTNLNPKRDLAGRHVLVTAGPTRERIDPVRYITNDSSGKMGYAIAEAALMRGARVTLVTGPVAITPPEGARVVSVESTKDMLDAVINLAEDCDMCVMAAAPADFTPASKAGEKLRRKDGLTLELVPTTDIAATFGAKKRAGQVLIAFAAETGAHLDHAREKLARKHADMVVFNDVTQADAGFNVDTNRVTFVTANGCEEMPLMSKRAVADALLDRALGLS